MTKTLIKLAGMGLLSLIWVGILHVLFVISTVSGLLFNMMFVKGALSEGLVDASLSALPSNYNLYEFVFYNFSALDYLFVYMFPFGVCTAAISILLWYVNK
jgi:hypothetical protein